MTSSRLSSTASTGSRRLRLRATISPVPDRQDPTVGLQPDAPLQHLHRGLAGRRFGIEAHTRLQAHECGPQGAGLDQRLGRPPGREPIELASELFALVPEIEAEALPGEWTGLAHVAAARRMSLRHAPAAARQMPPPARREQPNAGHPGPARFLRSRPCGTLVTRT